MGDVVLEAFRYLRKEIHKPVDIYELLQRVTTEVLGQVAFGYSFGVRIFFMVLHWRWWRNFFFFLYIGDHRGPLMFNHHIYYYYYYYYLDIKIQRITRYRS